MNAWLIAPGGASSPSDTGQRALSLGVQPVVAACHGVQGNREAMNTRY
jgi:hypothetical protein